MHNPTHGGKVLGVKPWMDPSEEPFGTDPPWEEDVYLPPRRRKLGAWVVTCMLSLSLGLVGWAAEKRYHVVAMVKDRWAGRTHVEAATEALVDPRVEAFLADGERALSEGGLDAAQGDFDKASVLGERDPRVLGDEARVAIAKADVPWLKLRLLAPAAAEDGRVTKAQLDELVAAARRAADDALSVAPHDPVALRSKLDSLRLAGDADGARAYVTSVAPQASQPDAAYSLAALDLLQGSSSSPSLPVATIVDRLRLAANAERNAGRARAALVYALARSGDVAGAKAELAKLDALARPYPVSPDLHAWMGLEAAGAAPAPPRVESPVLAPAPSAPAPSAPAPSPVAATVAPPARAQQATAAAPSGIESTVQAAQEAVRRGDYDRAERIYQAIVAMHPRDSQAMTSLGDVLRVHNDPWGAIETYQRAIEANPSYLPALLGLADTQWGRGDHEGGGKSYKRIVDRFPQGMYPGYVAQRAAP